MSGETSLPTVLLPSSFHFDPEKEIPTFEVGEWPLVPDSLGGWALHHYVGPERIIPIAVNLPDEETARLFAKAAETEQETTLELYGYSDTLCIQEGIDGPLIPVYYGKTQR